MLIEIIIKQHLALFSTVNTVIQQREGGGGGGGGGGLPDGPITGRSYKQGEGGRD